MRLLMVLFFWILNFNFSVVNGTECKELLASDISKMWVLGQIEKMKQDNSPVSTKLVEIYDFFINTIKFSSDDIFLKTVFEEFKDSGLPRNPESAELLTKLVLYAKFSKNESQTAAQIIDAYKYHTNVESRKFLAGGNSVLIDFMKADWHVNFVNGLKKYKLIEERAMKEFKNNSKFKSKLKSKLGNEEEARKSSADLARRMRVEREFMETMCNHPNQDVHIKGWKNFSRDSIVLGTIIGTTTLAYSMRDKLSSAIHQYKTKGDASGLKSFFSSQAYELVWTILYSSVPSVSTFFRKVPAIGKWAMDIANNFMLDFLYAQTFPMFYDPVQDQKKSKIELYLEKHSIDKFEKKYGPSISSSAPINKEEKEKYKDFVTALDAYLKEQNPNEVDTSATSVLPDLANTTLTSKEASLVKLLKDDPEISSLVSKIMDEVDYDDHHGILNTGSQEGDMLLFSQIWLYGMEPLRQMVYQNIKKTYCLGNPKLARLKFIIYQTTMYSIYWNSRQYFAIGDQSGKTSE